MTVSKNIGSMDRVIRGITGLWMVMDGLKHKGSAVRQMEVFAGGALIANAFTGHCAMLSAFGASTIPGTEDNVLNRLKTTLPGLVPQDIKSEKESTSCKNDESMEENLSTV